MTVGKLAPDAIPEFTIENGSIGTQELANGAVTTPKLANGSVGTDKLADDAVSTGKVADDSLTGADVDESTLGGPLLRNPVREQATSASNSASPKAISAFCPNGTLAVGGGAFVVESFLRRRWR